MLHKLFNRQDQRIAATLYAAAVGRARSPVFYRRFAVADSMDGRFDMVTLEVIVLLNRFKAETDKRAKRLSQGIFDMMFTDMDRTLRELGVGDHGVPHRVKKMAQAFYGRLAAYDAALAEAGDEALCQALQRNLYRGAEVAPEVLTGLAAYVRALAGYYADAPLATFYSGTLPPAPLPEE